MDVIRSTWWQNASNTHFKEVCDKINVDIAAGMKELYDTINVQIQNQTKQFHLANVATQASIAEVQGKFIGIETTLAAILAGQAKSKNARGSDDDHDAKKARGSEAWQIGGAVQGDHSIVSSIQPIHDTHQWRC